jgi:hypothetical protein
MPWPGDQIVAIELSDIPRGVCARLLTASSGSMYNMMGGRGAGFTNLVSSGIINSGVWESTATIRNVRNAVMNATQAGWMCKYGSNNYRSNREPTTPPLSGNVTVNLWILINA